MKSGRNAFGPRLADLNSPAQWPDAIHAAFLRLLEVDETIDAAARRIVADESGGYPPVGSLQLVRREVQALSAQLESLEHAIRAHQAAGAAKAVA